MVKIADTPWSEENLIATFESFGWTGGVMRSQDGTPWLPWCDWADLLPEQRGKTEHSGWTMHFFEPAMTDEDPLTAGIALFCGSFLPSSEGEDEDLSTSDRDAFLEAATEWASWTIDAQAHREAFTKEFTRIETLVREACGDPSSTTHDDTATTTTWDRPTTRLSLMISPNDLNYGVDDWISLRVIPVR